MRTSRSDWRSGKPFPPAPDSWVFTALFKAPRHCHCTSGSGWAARGRRRRREREQEREEEQERDRCALSDTASAVPPHPGPPARQDRQAARSTNPASKMPRSFLVKKHFNSSKKPNYSELDTHTGNKKEMRWQRVAAEAAVVAWRG